MNNILQRQLRRLGLDEGRLPESLEAWHRLLESVAGSYDEAERSRYLQERALRISSAEMQELYEKQRETSAGALRRERDLMRTVLETLESALFSVDHDGTILFANSAAERLYNRPGIALVGRRLSDALVCDVSGDSQPFRDAVESSDSIRSAPAHLVRPDNAAIPVAVNIEPMTGDTTGSVVLLRDLTDARQMTEELLKTRAHLGNLVTRAPIPFFEEDFTEVGAWLDRLREQGVTNIHRFLAENPEKLREVVAKIKILEANPAAYSFLAVPDGETLVGSLDPRLLSDETYEVILEQIEAIWNDQETLTTEVDGVKRNGERLVANFHWAAPRVDGRLDLTRVVIALTDITDVVESEERMRELIRSKDQFLASISHELRTPLTAVTAAAAMLDSEYGTLGPREQKELISMLSQESIEMAQIVEDLLVAARADLGSLTVLPRVIPIENEIHEVASRMESRGQHLRLGPIQGWAFADPLRVRQVLRNLVTNAFRYGGANVWIEAGLKDHRTWITVFDDGDGVPSNLRESIFEPYQQAHTAPGLPGSVGMGLSVARHLAQLMSGDLTYQYRNGVSEFTMTLPAATPAG